MHEYEWNRMFARIRENEAKAKLWDKAYNGVYDDEMPFTPERISLLINFANEHFPDYDTEKEFKDMITEYTDWETELTEAEEKLDAVLKIVGFWAGYKYESYPELRTEIQQLTGEIMTALKNNSSTSTIRKEEET